jgi:hypothetical protein
MKNGQWPMPNEKCRAARQQTTAPDQIMYFTRRKFLARAAVAAVAPS